MSNTDVFLETLDQLRNPIFFKKLCKKNIDVEILSNVEDLLSSSDDQLFERASVLHENAVKNLENFYGESGNILIPFSGGRDSTLVAEITMRNFKNRDIIMVTAMNGFAIGNTTENSSAQAKRLIKRTSCNAQHFFTDISHLFSKYVVDCAREDKDALGHPAICTRCKMIMEMALANVATEKGCKHIPYGYAQYQAIQQWTEQTTIFMEAMKSFYTKNYPYLNIGAPLKYILQTPIDSPLILGFLGLNWGNHKSEGKCAAGGMNPASINEIKLANFLKKCLCDEVECSDLTVSDKLNVSNRLIHRIEMLKSDKIYMQGSYNEVGRI